MYFYLGHYKYFSNVMQCVHCRELYPHIATAAAGILLILRSCIRDWWKCTRNAAWKIAAPTVETEKTAETGDKRTRNDGVAQTATCWDEINNMHYSLSETVCLFFYDVAESTIVRGNGGSGVYIGGGSGVAIIAAGGNGPVVPQWTTANKW